MNCRLMWTGCLAEIFCVCIKPGNKTLLLCVAFFVTLSVSPVICINVWKVWLKLKCGKYVLRVDLLDWKYCLSVAFWWRLGAGCLHERTNWAAVALRGIRPHSSSWIQARLFENRSQECIRNMAFTKIRSVGKDVRVVPRAAESVQMCVYWGMKYWASNHMIGIEMLWVEIWWNN